MTQELNPCFLCFLNWQVGSLSLALPGKPTYRSDIYHFTSMRRNSLNISCERVLLAKKKKKVLIFQLSENVYLEDNLLDKKNSRLVFWLSFSMVNIFSTFLLLEWVLKKNVM